jgi:hypothetical protein
MRARLVVIAVFLGCLLSPGWAAAQPTPTPLETTDSPTEADELGVLFPWASEPGGAAENWPEGVINFLLGVAGALVTVYLFLGDFLPSMGGKAEYELTQQELRDFKERRNRALAERERYAKGESDLPAERLAAELQLSDDFDRAIERLEKGAARERWRLFILGFPIYVLLGGFFASAFAVNALQAILIGFGWTAVADRIGLQRELQKKREIRDEQLDALEGQAIEAARETMRIRAENQALKSESANLRAVAVAAAVGPAPPSPGGSVGGGGQPAAPPGGGTQP